MNSRKQETAMENRRSILLLGLVSYLSLGSLVAQATGPRRSGFMRPHQATATKLATGQSATLLSDGRILTVGGEGPNGPSSIAELRDPQTGTITPLNGGLQQPRAWQTATVLPDGTVLIFGGIGANGKVLSTAESFDLASLAFHPLPITGLVPRARHSATLLTTGLLLVAGGISAGDETLDTAQLWDFRTGSSTNLARSLIIPRCDHTATLLPDGTVLLWGGTNGNGLAIHDGEVFDPVSNSFRIQTSLVAASSGRAPQVEVFVPDDGAENVPVNSLMALRFSEPLRVQTVNAESLTLSGPDGSVLAKVIAAEGGMLAFARPAASLIAGTTYTVTITGATDVAGVPLPSTSSSFRTAGRAPSEGVGILGGTQGQTGDPQGSPSQQLPPLQASSGVTAISGRALLLDGRPLAGVTLRVGSNRTETDATGRFLLRDVSGGHVAMVIDGRTAGEKRATYGVFQDGIDVTSGQTNVLKYTIWMPEIDTANAVTLSVPTRQDIVVTTPRIPGLEFHIPAGTTITDIDGKVTNRVSITPIPITQPPFPLPPGVNVPVYFTIQPGGGYLSVGRNSGGPKGGWLVYPNSFHQTAGSQFDFWNYDADEKGWYVYGHGTISSNGKSIVPDNGVFIYELTGAMVGASSLAAQLGAWWCSHLGFFCSADPVDLGTGLFVYEKTDLHLPDVIPIQLTRMYRPNDGASRAFGVGASHSYDMFLVGDAFPYTYIDVVMGDGSRVHCPRISTGTSNLDAIYQCNSTPGSFFGSSVIWNGGGWTLTRRDGAVYRFPDGSHATRGQQSALLSITDRNGNMLTVNRDANSNITEVTSPNGRWIQFTYDTNFRVTQAQDNIGRTVQYSYDSGGRLSQVIDANNGTWKYNYDSNNNMTSLIDPRNITYLQNRYDSQNRITKQTLADSISAYQFSYNPSPCSSNCSGIWETDVTDPDGNVEIALFNPAPIFSNGFQTGGSVSRITYAAGTSIAETYSYQYQSGTNLITSVADALNRTTSFSYDALGNITSTTRLAGTSNAVTTSLSYEPKFSQLTSITDPLNHSASFGHDANGNVISITDRLGHTSTLAYNGLGQLVSTTDPLGETASFIYDGGDLLNAVDPLGRSITFLHDSVGRLLSRADALNQRTKFSYNPLNQVTQIVDPNGGITSFAYDPNGNPLSVTDPRNTANPTTYTYDTSDRVATRKDAIGNQESYQYDGNSNLVQFTDRRGKIVSFSYDGLNRLTFAGFGKSGSTYESTITNTFDAGNRLTQAVDSLSGTSARGYDGLNRLTSDATPQGTVSYTYDSAGRRSTMTVPGQSAVNYTFDNANRLTQISQGTTTVSFGYDNANRRVTLTLPNGITTSYSYDNASELTGITFANNSTTLGNLTYAYDLVGRHMSVGGSYARTNLPLAVSATAYNAANQLTTWGTANLFYDANGNMTSDGTHSYTWDPRNRLTKIDNGSTASFSYDAFGRRVSKSILGTTTSFLYDGANVAQEVIGSNTANSLTGGIDEVFQRTDSAGARSFLTDALGSTLALTDSGGTPQTQYTFDPFGNTTLSGSSTTNSFAYTGRELDATGLYFYRARYYSSTVGGFISEDPVRFAGGMNLYAYTERNPIDFKDPFGTKKKEPSIVPFLRKFDDYIPAQCGGGLFNYGPGLRASGGVGSASINPNIRLADTRSGYSEGPFTDLTIGEAVQGGLGYATFTGGGTETFLFGGAGFDVWIFKTSVSGFVSHASGDSFLHFSVGINGDAGFSRSGGGAGAYLNFDSATSCYDHGGL